jgi:Holliday junction resolvasome RuvABC endonuclease subunit
VSVRVVGLDLSLRATGFADAGVPIVLSSRLRGLDRIAALRDEVLALIDERDAYDPLAADNLVVVEDYAFSRGASHAHELGELGGVIKLALKEAGITTVLIGPSSLKKFAANAGNANKIAMATAASRAGYSGPDDDNAIDAWWLRQFGLYRLGVSDLPSTAYRDEACSKVAWPALEAAT